MKLESSFGVQLAVALFSLAFSACDNLPTTKIDFYIDARTASEVPDNDRWPVGAGNSSPIMSSEVEGMQCYVGLSPTTTGFLDRWGSPFKLIIHVTPKDSSNWLKFDMLYLKSLTVIGNSQTTLFEIKEPLKIEFEKNSGGVLKTAYYEQEFPIQHCANKTVTVAFVYKLISSNGLFTQEVAGTSSFVGRTATKRAWKGWGV